MVDSWSLRDLAAAVSRRSALDCTNADREQLDDKIRSSTELLRKMLPANHWYVQAAFAVVMAGTRAHKVLDSVIESKPDASLPSLDVITASRDEVELQDDLHNENGTEKGTRRGTRDEARKMALKKPKEWMRTFLTVNSQLTSEDAQGLIKKDIIPFDLDGIDPRSRYQRQCYGPFLERWANDDPHVPETTLRVRRGKVVHKPRLTTDKHWITRTKPRKVGSTTFWKKFSVLCGANIDVWATLLHLPMKDDAKDHLRDIAADLRELNAKWPHLYPPLIQENYTEGKLALANGSAWEIRHADIKSGGVQKVGATGYNLVIISEAGKYERVGGGEVWSNINQAILPAVYPSTRNVIAHEGTNDEQAHELNRIAVLSYVDFQFFGAASLASNVGDPVPGPRQETNPAGRFADFEIGDDGEPHPICEKDYARKLRLTPEQVGFRRRKIEELDELLLVHTEYPYTYEESLGLVSGGFFMRLQASRAADRIGEFEWTTTGFGAQVQTVRNSVGFRDTVRGGWYMWDPPPLPPGEKAYYAVAGDFADGLNDSDYSPIGVARVNDGLVCAVRRTRIDPEISADEIAKAVSFYGHADTYVIGELNGPGKVALKAWEHYGHGHDYEQERRTKGYTETLKAVWFLQTPASREPLLIAFRKAYHNDLITIVDERFEWDAEGFVKNDKGKYEALKTKSERTG